MTGKVIEILDDFDPNKNYKIHIRKQIVAVLLKLEKGKQYKLAELIAENDGLFTKQKNLRNTRDVYKQAMKVGRDIGIIKDVVKTPISFENFCKLDTVFYMRRQLKQTKFKNPQAKTKHSGGGTRRSYSFLLWHFNNWLHGKTIAIPKVVPVGENLQKIDTVKIQLDTVEDLLKAYQESNDKGMAVIRILKEYLMDPEQHGHKSRGYMNNIASSIKAYFEKNESSITIPFNPSIDHDDISESMSDTPSTLTLEDLMELITTGKPSIIEKAVVLCKFHSGLDNSTFADRFNFEAFPQLVKWFGTDKHDGWDMEKCPVIINLTRIKVGFPHISCLDRDAVSALQKALDWRERKTGEPMKIGQAMFLNTKQRPVTDRWVSELITKLAERCGIQKSFKIKSGIKNEKVSHELRDLLKSTLNSCGVFAYASNHLIGHMPRDSYEKEAILYPEKIRAEYMKASKTLNLLTGFTNYVKHGDNADNIREELKIEIKKQMESKFDEKLNERLDQERSRLVNELEVIMKKQLDEHYDKQLKNELGEKKADKMIESGTFEKLSNPKSSEEMIDGINQMVEIIDEEFDKEDKS